VRASVDGMRESLEHRTQVLLLLLLLLLRASILLADTMKR